MSNFNNSGYGTNNQQFQPLQPPQQLPQQPPQSTQSNASTGVSTRQQLLLMMVLPQIIPGLVQKTGAALWVGYLVSAVPVLYCLLLEYRLTGKVSLLATPILVGIVAQVLLAYFFPSNKQIQNIGNVVTNFIIGMIFLVSMLFPENLIDKFAGQEVKDRVNDPNVSEDIRLKRQASFKKFTNGLCLLWGIGNLIIVVIILIVNFEAPAADYSWVQIGVSIGGTLLLAVITYLAVRALRERATKAVAAQDVYDDRSSSNSYAPLV
ncbi:hypothetical protein HK100_010582 [Physocladia obscura]|uniref:Uncharacterized protein n=1 Tax=Physocladia obscura TaxID=109957 RepID=A0AAD5XH06_9FUNG|nr:hypothetical protein HK100_010582 [Physocladia obscura]